jgi:hypothetical protein
MGTPGSERNGDAEDDATHAAKQDGHVEVDDESEPKLASL